MSATAPAPVLHPALSWVNSHPQALSGHCGRVVALVFWSASSAYCQNLLDDLSRLRARFPLALSVLGLHVPKFDAEIVDRTVLKAINRLGLKFPVANDRGWITWQHYGIASWPSVVLLDGSGKVRQVLTGDDQGAALERAIADLIDELGGVSTPPRDDDSLSGQEPATALAFPAGLTATDTHLYVADTGHQRILECNFDGRVLRQFGSGHADHVDGPAGEAAFRAPRGMCVIRDSIYVADSGNHAIRRIRLHDGHVETLLGNGRPGAPNEGAVPTGAACQLNQPTAVAGSGNRLFVALAGNNQLWEFDLTKLVMRFVAGTGQLGIADGPGHNAVFGQPMGLALVQQTLYVVDAASSAIRAVQVQNNTVQTLVGQGLYEFGETDGQRREARLQFPQGIALDPNAPVLWIADTYNGSLRGLRLGGGEVSTHSLPHPLDQPAALALAGRQMFIADTGSHEVWRHDLESGLLTRLPIGE